MVVVGSVEEEDEGVGDVGVSSILTVGISTTEASAAAAAVVSPSLLSRERFKSSDEDWNTLDVSSDPENKLIRRRVTV